MFGCKVWQSDGGYAVTVLGRLRGVVRGWEKYTKGQVLAPLISGR